MPPAELVHEGVYCSGPECHDIQAQWERPISEVQPPKASVKNAWPRDTEKPDFGAPIEAIRFIPAEGPAEPPAKPSAKQLVAGNNAKPPAVRKASKSSSSPPRKTEKKPAKKGAR